MEFFTASTTIRYHAMPVSTAFQGRRVHLAHLRRHGPGRPARPLQTTPLPGHSITVTQRFYLNQFRKDCQYRQIPTIAGVLHNRTLAAHI